MRTMAERTGGKTFANQNDLKGSLPCHRPFDLKRGDYTLRLGVVDRQTGLIGTATMKLTVP